MKNRIITYLLISCVVAPVWAQDESLDRNVTVERDFQPVVQSAGKISVTPEIKEAKIESAEIQYSDYNAILSPDFNVNSLLSQPTRFTSGQPYNGYIRAAFGHINTLFDFTYHLDDKNNSILDVYAHHKAEWGRRADSKTTIGIDFRHPFTTAELFFGVNGGNVYYTNYGRYYDESVNGLTIKNASGLAPEDKTALWKVNAFVGVRSTKKSEVQYLVQTGYALFAKPQALSEHQIRTTAQVDWHAEQHYVGANVYVLNSFIKADEDYMSRVQIVPDTIHSHHAFRIEPYYAYRGNRFLAHIGVNLDLNLNRGQLISNMNNVSFAPSPNVSFEAQIAKEWLTLYGNVQGSFGLGTVQEYMETMRYRDITSGVVSQHVCAYTPVDAEAGFHIRPYRDFLIEIHGGYAYQMNQLLLVANPADINLEGTTGLTRTMHQGTFAYGYSTYGRGKVGAEFSYHYQDIVNIHLCGDYFIWKSFGHEELQKGLEHISLDQNGVYDRPSWEINLRVDGRIDEHWSLYSDNVFQGKRKALTSVADAQGSYERTLKPFIELDLGCQYEMYVGKDMKTAKKSANLSCFFQLNNFIHRHNDIYYGYQQQGINFLLGASYKF